ncbi:MAG TPA: hypothetical protein VEF55_14410 [Candidatus Binatia bacterium]|nr:hypothetical protein [Candidatus Binatia bacterium]
MKAPYHSKAAASRAPQPESKTVRYRPEQEHVLRRLGEALVVQWDAVPDELQDLLIDQAALVDDREDAPHATGDIESFIRGAKVVQIAKAASPAEAER